MKPSKNEITWKSLAYRKVGQRPEQRKASVSRKATGRCLRSCCCCPGRDPGTVPRHTAPQEGSLVLRRSRCDALRKPTHPSQQARLQERWALWALCSPGTPCPPLTSRFLCARYTREEHPRECECGAMLGSSGHGVGIVFPEKLEAEPKGSENEPPSRGQSGHQSPEPGTSTLCQETPVTTQGQRGPQELSAHLDMVQQPRGSPDQAESPVMVTTVPFPRLAQACPQGRRVQVRVTAGVPKG